MKALPTIAILATLAAPAYAHTPKELADLLAKKGTGEAPCTLRHVSCYNFPQGNIQIYNLESLHQLVLHTNGELATVRDSNLDGLNKGDAFKLRVNGKEVPYSVDSADKNVFAKAQTLYQKIIDEIYTEVDK